MIKRTGDLAHGMSTKSTAHSAAGPYLGFGLQTVRLCARLLSEPRDSVVYVEYEDDVSVSYADGATLLEQVKRTTKNPLADWSSDLWKTIHNWLEDHGPIAGSDITGLCIHVSPLHAPGPFAAALLSANTPDEIDKLVAEIKKASTSVRKKSKAYPYVQRFLDADPAEQLALAQRFQIAAEDDPLAAIGAHFARAVSATLLGSIISFALGEAKRQTDRLLEMGVPGGLNAGEFQDRVRLFVQSINLPAYFDFDLPSPAPNDVDAVHSSKPVFIRQLEIIDIDKRQQLNAVSDYLRASASKTKWGADGILLPESLDEWDKNLSSRHAAICDSFALLHSHLDDVKRGMAIYAECRRLSMTLQGKTVPDHFTHGCFNDLSDCKRIGWHPNFADLLD